MASRIRILAGIILLFGSYGRAQVAGPESGPPERFAVARVHFEQNATDGDVEVVFEVKGGADGLSKLTAVSPDGRMVVDFTAADASTLGMRQFRFESPEPKNAESLKSAYPAGVYTFAGATAAGEKFKGESTLNHDLPAPASFLHPEARAQGVSTKGLKMTWTAVKNLAAYIISIEQEELEASLTARLPGSVTTFAVPEGFLLPDTQYTLGLGTVSDEGNVSFVETWFITAEKE
jgi:hypothetical protein